MPTTRTRFDLRLSLVAGMITTWTVMLCLPAAFPADEQAGDARVMSFNIRYGTANDGENHWDRRKEFLVQTIKAFDPDLLGTQETVGFQRDYLAQNLPDYDCLGVGRNDGRESGEMMALYFKKVRFEKLAPSPSGKNESTDLDQPLPRGPAGVPPWRCRRWKTQPLADPRRRSWLR